METARIELKPLLAALVGIAAIEVLAALAVTSVPANPLVFTGLVRLAETALIVATIRSLGPGVSALGFGRAEIPAGISRGLLWSAGFALLAAVAGMIWLIAGFDPLNLIRIRIPHRTSAILLLFLVGGIIGPVAEEFFFRGVVFGYLRRWGFWPSLILSTAFFVGLHPAQGGMPLPQIIGGLLFATAYECEHNLLVPIILHVLGNLALFSISIVL